MATTATKDKAKLAPAEVKKTVDMHTKAAENHTTAAKHHTDAAKHHEAGDHDKAMASAGKADDAHALASAAHTEKGKTVAKK